MLLVLILFLLLVATLFRQRPPYSPRHTTGPYSPAPTVRWVQITEFWPMEGGKREIYRSLDGPGKPPSSTPNPFLFLPQLWWWLFVEEVRTRKWKEHGSHPRPSQASYPSETFAKDSEWVRNKPFFSVGHWGLMLLITADSLPQGFSTWAVR